MALEIFRLVGSVFVDTDKANKSLQKTDKNAEGFGKTLLKGIGTAAKWAAGIATAAGTAAAALGTAAVNSFAEYEQLAGGIDTMFEDLSDDVKQYANNAYETAGLSANAYMETVLGFSASLTASLKKSEGNISRAAKLANQTVTDMADNAAKFGTDMASIQNAYSGFAKQNYTMLDNLKLGYGGTQKEMERLLKDAEKLSGVKYDINNLADVYEAIHFIQTEMGITGTVAAEGAATISGGIDLIKAKMANLVTKIGGALAPAAQSLITLAIDNLPVIEGLVDRAVPVISTGIEKVANWLSTAGDRVDAFVVWLRDLGDYATTTLGPIIADLSPVFQAVRDALRGVRDALNEYLTSGQAAEDATQFLKDAIKFLADTYAGAKDLIGDIVQGFKDTAAWARENETAVGLVAIAMGTLTAAIVAYNIAQAIKNAGGIVELAQLAAIQLGLWGLTAAEAAHTAATTVATAVTTAFGAAVSFLTSPITLVILAIGALIAIVFVLVKHWDDVKEAAAKCWDWIKATWGKVSDWFNTNVIQPLVKFFSEAWTSIVDWFREAWQAIQNVFSSVVDWIRENWDTILIALVNPVAAVFKYCYENFEGFRNFVDNIVASVKRFFSDMWISLVNGAKDAWAGIKNVFSSVGSWFSNIFTGALNGVKNVWSGIKTWFSSLLTGVKSVFSSIATAIGGIFKSPINTIIKGINAFISGLNKIKIPDWVPAVGGKGFKIATIPYLYEGAVLEKGQTGFLEGNGAEAVVPLHNNKKWIQAVANDMEGALGLGAGPSAEIVAILMDILERLEKLADMGIYLDTGALVGGLAKPMDRKLGQIQAKKARA